MAKITQERIDAYRRETFRSDSQHSVKDVDAAVEFVNQRGFAFFWPLKEITFPSLWTAVAGVRPVPNNHDDPGHVTWGWKDSLLGQNRWFYSKVLRKRATLISLETLPYFYALSENYGDPEEDYLILYEQGLMTSESKALYEAILDHGPMDTVTLRKVARLSNRGSASRFNRALAELQADFKLMPVGVAEAGAWRYAFIYEIVIRHHPEILEKAQAAGELAARTHLAERYLLSLGAATQPEMARLFGWRLPQVQRAIEPLLESGRLSADVQLPGVPGDWLALSELVTK